MNRFFMYVCVCVYVLACFVVVFGKSKRRGEERTGQDKEEVGKV